MELGASPDRGLGLKRSSSALLAQWLERAAVNRKVTGSIPVGSGGEASIRVFTLCLAAHLTHLLHQRRQRSLAVERLLCKQKVMGSIPIAGCTPRCALCTVRSGEERPCSCLIFTSLSRGMRVHSSL